MVVQCAAIIYVNSDFKFSHNTNLKIAKSIKYFKLALSICPEHLAYRISANSFRGNYSFLKV